MTRLGPGWVDAHLHLADLRVQDPEALIQRAQSAGIHWFVQGGVGPEDWARQRELAARVPGVLPVFGLHPYWVADHSEEECESALDQLAREISGAAALGETGLDFRPHIAKDSEDRQIQCFEAQLELARVAGKPVVLHIVQAHEEALRVLDLFGTGVRGMVHAFTGTWPQAQAYLKRGLLISVGGPVCRPEKKGLHQAVQMIPLESLVLETDSPDQPPPGVAAGQNEPRTLLQVAEKVAELRGLNAGLLLDKAKENLENLLYGTANSKSPTAP